MTPRAPPPLMRFAFAALLAGIAVSRSAALADDPPTPVGVPVGVPAPAPDPSPLTGGAPKDGGHMFDVSYVLCGRLSPEGNGAVRWAL